MFAFTLLFNKLMFTQINIEFIDFKIYNQDTKIYFIGETHYKKSNKIIIKDLIDYFIAIAPEKSINLFIEYPFCLKESFQYITKSQNITELNQAMKVINQFPKKDFKEVVTLLNFIKGVNLQFNQKINVIPFDTYAFYNIEKSLQLLNSIFPTLQNNPKISSYFSMSRKVLRDAKKCTSHLSNFLTELNNNEEFKIMFNKNQKHIITESVRHLLNELDDPNFSWSPKREYFMTKQIIENVDETKINLIICGANHAYKSETHKNYESHFSMASQVWQFFLDKSNDINNKSKVVQSVILRYQKRKSRELQDYEYSDSKYERIQYLFDFGDNERNNGFDKTIIILKK